MIDWLGGLKPLEIILLLTLLSGLVVGAAVQMF